ncbi:TPR domain protein [Chaetomium fimeti]|uniref:TPR domain protein n=1 Tax=Chaetomium fimeti TaxID=1854472 RepID=A0AAE0HCR0_9PEZI|nr:TPR domain protein [Chaetomium fimeti]
MRQGTRLSYVPPSYPPCVAPFSELKKTMMGDLLLETHNRGTYMLVRSLTPQDRTTAVLAIVEDEKGDVLMLQLHHQVDDREPLVREGTVMILKEPFFRMMMDGNYGLRVDHVSDVVLLPANDERIPAAWRGKPDHSGTALAWKAQGNNHFNRSEYRSAIECYTQSLAYPSTLEEICTVRLSRSVAFLKARQYDAALLDTELVTTTAAAGSNLADKARFRKAEALYGLERYRECCEVLKELRLDYPHNAPAKALLTRGIARLAEQTNGEYQFKQLHDDAAKLRPPHLDHATYIGPVRVQDAGSRGRGLFTTKAVKAGDLLFCEKAFAYVFSDADAGTREVPLLVDPRAGGTVGTQSDLVNMTIQKLHRNPSLTPAITNLHHGSYQPVATTQVDGQSIIDSFHVRRTVGINVFSSSLSSLVQLANPNGPMGNASGIWPLASYLNHSCAGNAFRAFIGDLLIARATRDLPAGTELTWWYYLLDVGGESEGEKRSDMLRHWGFECDCPLCADAKRSGERVARTRRALVTELERGVEELRRGVEAGVLSTAARDAVLRSVESGVEALEETYARPAEEVPRFDVWGARMDLVEAVWVRRRTMAAEQAVRLMLRALGALGYVIEGGERGTVVVRKWGVMDGGVVGCWMLLRDAYRETAPELVAPAEEYARTAYRTLIGEDETFVHFRVGPATPTASWSQSVTSRPSPSRLSGGSSPPRSMPTPSTPRPAATSRWGKSARMRSAQGGTQPTTPRKK